MSTIYRNRDRDRYDDSRSTISTRRDGGNVTVKRYIVKDDDSRSSYGRESDRRTFLPERSGERVEETRIVRREREESPIREHREEPRYASSELVIRTDKEDDRRGHDRRDERTSDREIVIRRTSDRDEPRREDRYDDRREIGRHRDDWDRDRDLTRYSRNTEYYAPPPPPQVIVVKQEPIIIRERVRDDDYQMVRRDDFEEERSEKSTSKSIVRRERTPEPPREEQYFYEKKIRERVDDRDDWHERRSMKREVSPHDSVSQVGGGRRSRRNSYSSDDSMVYVRRTKEEYSDDEGESHKKRDAIAGAIAGIGAAELLRNHQKKEGKETSGGIGRIGRDVGAGALGVVAAKGIQRARSEYRSRSRKRRSRSRGRGRSGSRSRSRSRSRSSSRGSHSKLKTWGTVGLGAAALAAAAAFAQKKLNNNKEGSPDGRGRSHSRGRGESVAQLANDPTADDARNPKHRNIRMAEVGAAGAAITALIERQRSKSKGGRNRSQSRVRQAIPVIAAGLGSAALAGLYEKNKAKKEATTIAAEERQHSRSRSRGRSESTYYDGPREGAISDPAMIEYGDGPMHGNNYGPDYYGRAAPQEGYYANQTAVVPAGAVPPQGYGAQQGDARGFSQERRSRSRSVSSSPGGHHRDRRSSSAANTAAAGAAAAAMSEHDRKKLAKRERRARREQEQYARNPDPYEDTYNPQYQQAAADPYAQPGGFYPQTSQFPPPPGTMPPPGAAPGPPPGTYAPQDFPPPPPGGPPQPGYDAYASGANPYAPHRGAEENVSVAQDGLNRSRSVGPGAPPFSPQINVHPPSMSPPPPPPSVAPAPHEVTQSNFYMPPTDRAVSPPRTRERATSQPPPSDLNVPRKSVQFAEKPEVSEAAPVAVEPDATAPEDRRHRHHRDRTARGYEAGDDTDSTPDDMRRRSQKDRDRGSERSRDPEAATAGEDGKKRRHHHRRRSADPSRSDAGPSTSVDRDRALSPAESDATVELPSRFDDKGRRRTEVGDDQVADRIDEILQGKGAAGKLFGNFVGGLFPEGRRKKGGE